MNYPHDLLPKLFRISLMGAIIFNVTDAITTFVAVEICHYPELGDFKFLLEQFGALAYLIKVAAFSIFAIVAWKFRKIKFDRYGIVLFLITLAMVYAVVVFGGYTIENMIGIAKCLAIK